MDWIAPVVASLSWAGRERSGPGGARRRGGHGGEGDPRLGRSTPPTSGLYRTLRGRLDSRRGPRPLARDVQLSGERRDEEDLQRLRHDPERLHAVLLVH